MKHLITFILVLTLIFPGCSKSEDSSNPRALFLEFWTFVDQNYIYFDLKQVNWDAVYETYAPMITDATSEDELFGIMESALLELRDTHNRLEAPGKRARTFNFREGYSTEFSFELIQERYITDPLGVSGYLSWYMLEDDIGYLRFPVFNRYQHFVSVLQVMKERKVKKLIIDVRGNDGGDSDRMPDMLGALSNKSIRLGAYVEKSGPEHNDITNPLAIFTSPNREFVFDIPIVVLIDRGCYSATSYFAAMIKNFDTVTLVGQVTGGGGGGNLGCQLSNGWLVAVSVSDFLDGDNVSIEEGVQPDVEVVNTSENIENEVDVMLETAIGL